MSQKVSVIIPTYNYSNFLENCINSVLNQTYKNLEVVVVDDGSTDNTRKIVSNFKTKIKYIYQENSGLSSARNTGIKNATGDYFQFLDSDDLLHRRSIEHRIKFFEKNPNNKIAVCNNFKFSKLITNKIPLINGRWNLHQKNLDIHLCYFNIAPIHAFLFNENVISDVGYFDTSLEACEDYDYLLRALGKGYVPQYSEKGIVYYRKHSESMSKNLSNQYHHDGLVHKRLYDLLFIKEKINVANKFAAILAFICGLLTTLNRMNNADLKLELESLIKPSFDFLFDLIKDKNIKHDYETSYYLIKLNTLSHTFDSQAKVYMDILKENCLADQNLNTNLSILRKAVFNKRIDVLDKLILFIKSL